MKRPYWYIPAHKDAKYLATDEGTRVASLDYLQQIAQAIDHLGFGGALVPTGTNCEDSWVTASFLAAQTRRLNFIVAVRPGLVAASTAARMAATFDRLSGGRLIVNVVGGGDPVELAGDGLLLDHDERYQLMDEFLQVWRPLVAGEEVSFEGRHVRVSKGNVLFPCVQTPHPRLFMGGSSDAALRIAARHIDTLLTWGEPPADIAGKLAAARQAANAEGRSIHFGIRLHLVLRDTDEAAWTAANELIRHVTPEKIIQSQAVLGRTQSHGQKRMNQLHGGRTDRLEISPNLWAGIGLVTGGAGTALVGSPATIAARLREYEELGIESFILSGYPHLEEAYRVAETLFPLLEIEEEAEPLHRERPKLRAKVIPGGW